MNLEKVPIPIIENMETMIRKFGNGKELYWGYSKYTHKGFST